MLHCWQVTGPLHNSPFSRCPTMPGELGEEVSVASPGGLEEAVRPKRCVKHSIFQHISTY